MSKKDHNHSVLGPKAMEMVMRDVLGGMEDLAIMKSFEADNNVFEILAITPVKDQKALDFDEPGEDSAKVIPFVREDRKIS